VHEGARAHAAYLVRAVTGLARQTGSRDRDVRRRVDGLYFYPVKSCRGTSLDAAEVGHAESWPTASG
jgi:hypothetical protein